MSYDTDPICPLTQMQRRLSPTNAIEAFSYQLHDEVRMLWVFSHLEQTQSAVKQVAIIDATLSSLKSAIEQEGERR